jgi:hypothetical protein
MFTLRLGEFSVQSFSKASSTAVAVLSALCGFMPVTTLPSATWKLSQTPLDRTSAPLIKLVIRDFDLKYCQQPRGQKFEEWNHVHFAPSFSAHSSMRGSFQLRMASMTCMSFSASVVKPVIVFPAITDLPVAGSIIPGKIAPP